MNKTYKSVKEMINEITKEREAKEKTFTGWLYYNIWLSITSICGDVIFFFRVLLPGYFQRGKRGWANHDTWGLDITLAKIIADSVKYLRKNTYGYPTNLTKQKWNSILKRITWTFMIAQKVSNREVYLTKNRKQYLRLRKIIRSDSDLYNGVVIFTHQKTKKFYKGFDLFKKYFFNLWD